MAFPPSFSLVLVPSRSIIAWSITRRSVTSIPCKLGRYELIDVLDSLLDALAAISLAAIPDSMTSRVPVEAPEGAIAEIRPLDILISASTVGLPLESSTSRPRTSNIWAFDI